MSHLDERWPKETEIKEIKVLSMALVLEVTYKTSGNTEEETHEIPIHGIPGTKSEGHFKIGCLAS